MVIELFFSRGRRSAFANPKVRPACWQSDSEHMQHQTWTQRWMTCHHQHHQQELLLGATFYWLVSRTKLIHPFTDFIILHVLWREFKNKVKFKNLLKQSTALAFPWWCGSGTVRPTVPPPRLRNIRSICVISNILTLLYILYNRPIWYSKVK